MKIFLAAFGGIVATLAVYASGFLTAMFFLSADPTPVWKPSRDSASVWTLEPVVVSEADEAFERLPSRQVTDGSFASRVETAADDVELAPGPDQPIDATLAASIADEEPVEPMAEAPSVMNTAHAQWCADRFRSYRVEDNSYTAHSGERRECASPFLNGSERASRDAAYADMAGNEAVDSEAAASTEIVDRLSQRHIQSCFDRYRSYRPEDNSYQPYRGGPRRQCR